MAINDKLTKGISDVVGGVGKTAVAVTDKTKNLAVKTKDVAVQSTETVFNTLDVNGDGEVGIEDVIIMGLGVPGIKFKRSEFLRKELFKNYS